MTGSKQKLARPGEPNAVLIDRYSWGHFGAGFVAGFSRIGPMLTFAGSVAWEIVERPLKDRYPEYFFNPTQDTASNMIGDCLFVMAGWAVGRSARYFVRS